MSVSTSSNASHKNVSHQYQVYTAIPNFPQPLPPLKRARPEDWEYLPPINTIRHSSLVEDHYQQRPPKRIINNSVVHNEGKEYHVYGSTCSCCPPKQRYEVADNSQYRFGMNKELSFERQSHQNSYPIYQNLQKFPDRYPIHEQIKWTGPLQQHPTEHFDEMNYYLKKKNEHHDLQKIPYHTEPKYSPPHLQDQIYMSNIPPFRLHQLQQQQSNTYERKDIQVLTSNKLPQEEYINNINKKRILEVEQTSPSLSPSDSKIINMDHNSQSKSEARRNASQKRLRDSKGRFTSKIRYATSKAALPSTENKVLVSNTTY